MTNQEVEVIGDDFQRNIKNFRGAPEVEALYRFLHENDLRREGLILLTKAHTVVYPKRKKRRKKKNLH